MNKSKAKNNKFKTKMQKICKVYKFKSNSKIKNTNKSVL